jgi:hypothetical protein
MLACFLWSRWFTVLEGGFEVKMWQRAAVSESAVLFVVGVQKTV